MAGTVPAAIIPHPVPIYEYKCENGHVFDVIQQMTDEALTECQECGAPAVRVLHSAGDPLQGLRLPQHRLRQEEGRRQRRSSEGGERVEGLRLGLGLVARTPSQPIEELRLEGGRLEGEGRRERLSLGALDPERQARGCGLAAAALPVR